MANNTNLSLMDFCLVRKYGESLLRMTELLSYLPYIVLVLGIFLNMITIIATYRKARKSSCHFYMMMVAWADLYVIVSEQVMKIVEFFKPYYTLSECRLIGFHEIFPPQIAILLLVCMTIDRCIAVTRPLRSNRLCTVRRGIITTVSTACVLLVYNTTTILVYGQYHTGPGRINCIVTVGKPWRSIYEISNRIISNYMPFITLLSLNVVIARTVCRALKRQATLAAGRSPRQEATRRVTIMVVIVSFAFLVLVFPTSIAFLMTLKYENWDKAINEAILYCKTTESEVMVFMYYTGKILYPFNHVINGLIYLVSSSQFRRDLINNLRCGHRRLHRKSNGTGAIALSTISATSATSLTYTPSVG
ncbi:FMRFamide receptor-like [Tubulanus polymorphus]|uniref:FMRFamide receptor-like n=1 Tax=Tubulanus polymorphus TaxID=672921 RepID=UPI003DA34C81